MFAKRLLRISFCHTPTRVVIILSDPITCTSLVVGFKRMVKDAALERKVYNIDQMTKLFNLTAGLKGADLESPDLGQLSISQFLTLLINLAFYRENPRYTPQLEGAPKLTQTTVPLLQCIKNMLNDAMPKMRKGDNDDFRMVRIWCLTPFLHLPHSLGFAL